MSKLIISCMDGASALSRRVADRYRPYCSDIVYEIVSHIMKDFLVEKEFDESTWNRFQLALGSILDLQHNYLPIYLKAWKGDLINRNDRELERYIMHHNDANNYLICIGKSMGGTDTARFLKKIIRRLNYKKIAFVSIDSHYPFRFGKKIKIPTLDTVYNIFQTNPPLCGAILESHKGCSLNQYNIKDSEVNHWNIIQHPMVKRFLYQAVSSYILEVLNNEL